MTDTPDRLRARIRGELLAVTVTPLREAKEIAARLPEVRSVEIFGNQLHILVVDAERDEPLLRRAFSEQGMHVSDVRCMVPGLEDVFISLLSEEHA